LKGFDGSMSCQIWVNFWQFAHDGMAEAGEIIAGVNCQRQASTNPQSGLSVPGFAVIFDIIMNQGVVVQYFQCHSRVIDLVGRSTKTGVSQQQKDRT